MRGTPLICISSGPAAGLGTCNQGEGLEAVVPLRACTPAADRNASTGSGSRWLLHALCPVHPPAPLPLAPLLHRPRLPHPRTPLPYVHPLPHPTHAPNTARLPYARPQVIMFDPMYDSYTSMARRAGATIVPLRLRLPDFAVPVDELEAAVTPRTRMIMVNTPHNPSGKVGRDRPCQAIASHAHAGEGRTRG